MKARKPHMAVFLGGEAGSHDLSWQTGELLSYYLPRDKYRVTPVRITPEGEWQVPLGSLPKRGPVSHMMANLFKTIRAVPPIQGLERLLARPVNAFVTTLRGRGGDGGEMHGLAGAMGIAVVGSDLTTCQRTSDKHVCGVSLSDVVMPPLSRRFRQGTPVPTVIEDVREWLVPPLFVKPVSQEGSVGVKEVLSVSDLSGALKGTLEKSDVLIQQRSPGQEINITVYDDAQGRLWSLPPTLIEPAVARYFDHMAKRRAGRVNLHIGETNGSEAVAEAELLARDIYQEINARGLVSFDFVADEDGSLELLDVNTVPTLTSYTPLLGQLRAGGVHPGTLFDSLIERSL